VASGGPRWAVVELKQGHDGTFDPAGGGRAADSSTRLISYA